MQVITSGQHLCCNDGKPHIFLAGPTPRTKEVAGWRDIALNILRLAMFDGIVSAPEPFCEEYATQVEWEEKHLEMATCILFWIPRDLETMPGFTTNIEWGEWYKSNKVVLGYPRTAKKMKYLEYKAKKRFIPREHTIERAVKKAINIAKFNTERIQYDWI